MKILLSGGGTAGHITPILAVAAEIKKQHPRCHIVYVGERGGKFARLARDHESVDEVRAVFAGKFRRYHGDSWLKRLFDIKTNLLNLRDLFLIFFGIIESLVLIRRLGPDAVLLKGGYVVVPVGFASAIWRIPYVTHDSDALPGLANRIIAPWASAHATALPAEFYMYPRQLTRYVGVLTGETFQPITRQIQARYKAELGVPADSRLLLVTGGSLGAKRLNEAFSDIVMKLLQHYNDLYVVHQTGKNSGDLYDEVEPHPRLIVLDFLQDMHRYTGAADVIVARAGANTLGELGVQGKACVIVPNSQLTSGHQVKNADRLADKDAAVVVHEKSRAKDAKRLDQAIRELLKDEDRRKTLSKNLRKAYPPKAAHKLAMLLLEVEKYGHLKGNPKKT